MPKKVKSFCLQFIWIILFFAGNTHSAVNEHSTDAIFLTDWKEATSIAAKEKKPVFIYFYASWCPPCALMEEEVFSKPAFRKATDRFVRLKLDADSFGTKATREKYQIDGYPTIVFASSSGDEITRISLFRPLETILQAVQSAWESRDESYSRAKVRADQGDRKARDQIGLLHYERLEYSIAQKYLEGSKAHQDELIHVQAALYEKTDFKLYKSMLEKGITLFPRSYLSLIRHRLLAEISSSEGQIEKQTRHLNDMIRLGQYLATHPDLLKDKEMIAGEVLNWVAEGYQALGKHDLATATYIKAAEEFKKHVQSEADRGANIYYAQALWKAGKINDAEKVYRDLERLHPKESSVFSHHAQSKFEQKKFNEAADLAEKAYEFAYGENKLRMALRLAKIYEAAGKEEKALKLLETTLNTNPIESTVNSPPSPILEILRKLKRKLVQREK